MAFKFRLYSLVSVWLEGKTIRMSPLKRAGFIAVYWIFIELEKQICTKFWPSLKLIKFNINKGFQKELRTRRWQQRYCNDFNRRHKYGQSYSFLWINSNVMWTITLFTERRLILSWQKGSQNLSLGCVWRHMAKV